MTKWFWLGAVFVFISFVLIPVEITPRTVLGKLFLGFAFGCAFLDGMDHGRKEATR